MPLETCPKCGKQITNAAGVCGCFVVTVPFSPPGTVFSSPGDWVPLARAEAAEAECAAWREWFDKRPDGSDIHDLAAWSEQRPKIGLGASALLDRLRRAEEDSIKVGKIHMALCVDGTRDIVREVLRLESDRDRLKAEVERMKDANDHMLANLRPEHMRELRQLREGYADLKAENERLREWTKKLEDMVTDFGGCIVGHRVLVPCDESGNPPPFTSTSVPVPSFCPAHGKRLPCGECEGKHSPAPVAIGPDFNPRVCMPHGNNLPCNICGWRRRLAVAVLVPIALTGLGGLGALLADHWPAVQAWVERWFR